MEKQIKAHWEKEGVGSFLGDRLEVGRKKFVGCAINDYYEGPLVIKNEKSKGFLQFFWQQIKLSAYKQYTKPIISNIIDPI